MVECGSMQRIGQQDPVILSERNDFGERHVPRGEPGKSSGESPLIGIPKPDWGLPHRGIAQVPTELPSNSKREDNGPVSRLQEWVQAQSKQGNYQRILHWFFDQQMEDRITLQFKATVSFMLDNVPHHIEGEWQTSKKKSQRDAAERALFHFTNLDDVLVPKTNEGPIGTLTKLDPYIKYAVEEQESGYRATAQLAIGGAPHYFRGSWQGSNQGAKEDCANRTLAYLRVPEYRAWFEAPAFVGAQETTFDMKVHTDGNYASRVAQQKTALMQVQNLLQKVYSKDIVPGQDMWEWHWESDPATGKSHHVIVTVPVTGRSFSGQWCTGKKEAQRTTCEELKKFLQAKLKEQQDERPPLVGRKDAPHRGGRGRD